MPNDKIIVQCRFLTETGDVSTTTSFAMSEDAFESHINSEEEKGKKFGRAMEAVYVRRTADPRADQEAFAVAWNTILLDKSIPFAKKLVALNAQYRTTRTILFESPQLLRAMEQQTLYHRTFGKHVEERT